MTKEEYLKELNKAFGDFKFFDEDHHYEYKGKRVGISVTKLIEEYTQEFDSQAVAERVAKKQGKLVQEVLDEWEYKNKFSCNKGTNGHNWVQSRWNKEKFVPIEFDDSEEFNLSCIKVYNQGTNFYNDYKDRLEHLADEYIIGDNTYSVASAVDHLFINKLTGGLVLVDYKTNSDIHKNEKYAKKMKAPLNNIKDDSIHHYYIQLSIYKYLIEKHTPLKIEEMFIVWFSENNENYEILDIPYLKKEVEKILEWEMWK